MTTRHVESADGTRVAVRVTGSGPPMLVLPGAMSGGLDSWAAVAEDLAGGLTVWPIARRGYPPSGPVPPGTNSFAAETVRWPRQSHFANALAPGLVAGAVRDFLARRG